MKFIVLLIVLFWGTLIYTNAFADPSFGSIIIAIGFTLGIGKYIYDAFLYDILVEATKD